MNLSSETKAPCPWALYTGGEVAKMKYGYIVEEFSDFKIGQYYVIVCRDKIIDRFLCNNLNASAAHYLNYSSRGCEIMRYLSPREAQQVISELCYKKSEYFDLFSHSKRSNSAQLKMMCELANEMKKIKTLFLE